MAATSLKVIGRVKPGWKDSKEFKRRIRWHDDFRAALEDAGIEEWGKGRWPKGFRLFGTRFLTS